MSIFGNTAYRRDILMHEGDMYYSNRYADEFTQRLSNKMARYGAEAKTKTAELTSTFNPEMMKDVYEERDATNVMMAEAFSQSALKGLNTKLGAAPKSEKGFFSRIQSQKQALKKAQTELSKANELYKQTGSSFRFDTTGFTPIKASAQQFYNEFDTAVEQRKQEYAELYGLESFDDFEENYGMSQDYFEANLNEEDFARYTELQEELSDLQGNMDYYSQQRMQAINSEVFGITSSIESDSRVGKRDILDMVMGDIIGMDYGRLARLNTIKGTGSGLLDYTGDQMTGLRDFYATSKLSGIEQANKAAEIQDRMRREGAISAQKGKIASQKKRGKTAQESIASSQADINIQLRELDEQFMKNVGAFSSAPKKRKVPKISFVEGRPE